MEDFFILLYFIYFWLFWVSMLCGLFCSCGEWGLLFVAMLRLLIAVACGAQALGRAGFISLGTWV